MDLNRLSTLGKKGVLLLLADSTNIERQGHSLSEKTIGETLNRIFAGSKGRIIVATFASNIHRMQQIANASIKENRKIVFSGRSMENVSKVAIELGYLDIPQESLIDIDDMQRYPDENITIISFSDSIAVIFFPISPNPPRGIILTLLLFLMSILLYDFY